MTGHPASATPTTNNTWSTGGKTTLADGRLLCPRHHARAHDPTFTITKLPGGKVAFHRRT